jgi:hypothetical protein
MKNIICYLFDHDLRYNYLPMPSKCICNRCGTKSELNLVNLEWEEVKSFTPILGTDKELKRRWHKKNHFDIEEKIEDIITRRCSLHYKNGEKFYLEGGVKTAIKEALTTSISNITPADIRDEMDSDMQDSGIAQGEIESCLNHWNNKYIIKRK